VAEYFVEKKIVHDRSLTHSPFARPSPSPLKQAVTRYQPQAYQRASLAASELQA